MELKDFFDHHLLEVHHFENPLHGVEREPPEIVDDKVVVGRIHYMELKVEKALEYAQNQGLGIHYMELKVIEVSIWRPIGSPANPLHGVES